MRAAHLVDEGCGPGKAVARRHGRGPGVQPRHGDPAAVAAPVAVLRRDLAEHLGHFRAAARDARPELPPYAPQEASFAGAGSADEQHHGEVGPVEQVPSAPGRGPAEQPGDQTAVVQQLVESEFIWHGPSGGVAAGVAG
ncbi:hypothetical protein ABZ953_03865 [Streptomyces sp. NPDC046465]|uniref:hypothetical protein n=1 Tax=Streptomyces sp. NPDC046465 TaxID=3155810 RepID=UPI0033C2EC2D